MLSRTTFSQRINSLAHNKTIRNGGFFSILSFLNRGINFVLLTILARYINPADYGELSLFNTVVMFLGYFVGLSTAGYMGVSYFKESKEQFKKDFSAICLITFATTSIILIFFLLSSQWLSGIFKITVDFLFFGLLISFANVFVGLNLDYLRVQERLTWYGILSCSFAILNFIFALYLVIVENCNWKGQVYAQLACNVVYGIIALACFIKYEVLCIPKLWSIYKNIIIWGLPIIPHLAAGWIKQGLDKYIIEGTQTLADVGIFSFAMTLSGVIIMIGLAFNQTNSVNLYQTLSSEGSKEAKLGSLRRKEKYFSVLYLVLTGIIVICGSILIPIIMPMYSGCVPYFILLSIYGFFQCIYFLYTNYLFYYDHTKQLMYITFGSSIFHFLLSFWLTRFSLYLTCLIYIVSIAVVVLLVFLQSRKVINEKLI